MAMSLIADLCVKLGMTDINRLTGCAELTIDDQWWIAVNGHAEPTKCSHGADVPPFTAYVELRGMPAGIIDPGGGCMTGGEDEFIAALKRRIAEPNHFRDDAEKVQS